MAGVKGQKWAPEKRRPVKHKVNLQLTQSEYSAVETIANEHDWSVSKVIRKIIIGDLAPIRGR